MRRIALPLVVFVLIGLVVIWVLGQRENTLVTRSRRLLTSSQWVDYEWLDNDHLLYYDHASLREFCVLDLRTGNRSLVPLSSEVGIITLCPDGRSLLAGGSEGTWCVPVLSSVGPKKVPNWPDRRFVGWADQGKTMLMDRGGFWDQSGYRPRQYELYTWPGLKELRKLPRTAALPIDEKEWAPSGWSQGKEYYHSTRGGQTQVAAADPFTGGFALTHVELPIARQVVEAVVSPDGEEIFWNLNKRPGEHPFLGEATFWVSRADGTGFRKVAQTGEDPLPPYTAERIFPRITRWRPDGTAVVIGYRDGVFLLPVR